MDPNETLRMIRQYVQKVNEWRDLMDRVGGLMPHQREEYEQDTFYLAEYTEAMDGWLSKGGFPPSVWPVASVL